MPWLCSLQLLTLGLCLVSLVILYSLIFTLCICECTCMENSWLVSEGL